jgi:hypothetical protein
MAKAAPHAPKDKVDLYERLVATIPEVEPKGAANPYTSVNGNMFSQLLPSGHVSLRLSESDRAAFIKKFNTKNVEQYGVVQKEYVEMPDTLLSKTTEAAGTFAKATNTPYRSSQRLRSVPDRNI